MGCSGYGMFEMWDVRDVGCSGCGMFVGTWDVDFQNAYNNETSYLFLNGNELSEFQRSQALNEQHIYTRNTVELKSFCL